MAEKIDLYMKVGDKGIPTGGSLGGGGSSEPSNPLPPDFDAESLLERVQKLEVTTEEISQKVPADPVLQVDDGDAEETLAEKTVVAAHTAKDGRFGAATAQEFGHVKVVSNVSDATDESTVLSAMATARLVSGAENQTWPKDSPPSFGMMIDESTCLVTTSGTYQLPAGRYELTIVGGGYPGSGGSNAGMAGDGGAAAIPTIKNIASMEDFSFDVTIGASNGATTVSVMGNQFVGAKGSGAGGKGGAACSAASGTRGADSLYMGGAGGAGRSYDGKAGGGGGGDASRLPRYLETFPTAANGGSTDTGAGAMAYGGRGGQGYGAGGGGGASRLCSGGNAARGGAGAPGCLLIEYRGPAL